MHTRRLYALFGLLATALGMAVGHFMAALIHPDSSPVLAVGSTVIDLTPVSVKEWGIKHFESDGFSIAFLDFPAQNYDKVILVGSVMVGVLVLAAIAGVVTRRRFALGAGMLLALVAVAGAAVVTRPTVEVVDIIPTLLTAAAGVAALYWLDRQASTETVVGNDAPPEQASGGPTRRGVLIALGVVTAAAVVLGTAGKLIIGLRARPEDVVLPAPTNGLGALPTGLDDQVPGITPFRIENDAFYRVDTRLDTPVVSSEGWTLTVDGDVDNELTITFDELLAMPMVERDITLTCVSNSVGGKYVGAGRWLGVPLKDILDRAGVGDSADQILSTDFDGMTISTPLDLATDGRDAMIVVGFNGEQLLREHGFPVRMVIPGLYGFISATKWLTKLTLTTYADQEAYWTKKNWATDAPIKPSARIDTPRALSEVRSGKVVVGGVAWAQNDGGVAKVQVQVDGGAWQDATLGPDAGNIYWRQWFYTWGAESGQHNLSARVIDNDGGTQTAVRAEPFPEGASGIHTLIVNVA